MADNVYSISYFKNKLRTISNTNRYRIYINNKHIKNILGEDYSIYAKEVTLPGQSLNTTSIVIQGSTRNVPMGMDYDPITVTFLCDSELKPRKAIELWMRDIFSKENYITSFLDDYKCNIYIECLDRKNKKMLKIELQDAWPKEISETQLGYDNNDQLFEFNVTFSYYSWLVKEN